LIVTSLYVEVPPVAVAVGERSTSAAGVTSSPGSRNANPGCSTSPPVSSCGISKDWPPTVALGISKLPPPMVWPALVRLHELTDEGKVKQRKVGAVNLWMVTNSESDDD
jgi:hypothetical protein